MGSCLFTMSDKLTLWQKDQLRQMWFVGSAALVGGGLAVARSHKP